MTTDTTRRGKGGKFTSAANRAHEPEPYYGFDPEAAYLLRSRVRAYNGTTERFVFANGQGIAMPMKPEATEEQKWARGERLGRLTSDPTYRVYPYGEEPPAAAEPLWRGQEDPTAIAGGEDTGEDTHVWQSVPRAPVQMPVEGPTPSGRTSNELAANIPPHDRDTGEQPAPKPDPMTAPSAPPAWDRAPGAESAPQRED